VVPPQQASHLRTLRTADRLGWCLSLSLLPPTMVLSLPTLWLLSSMLSPSLPALLLSLTLQRLL